MPTTIAQSVVTENKSLIEALTSSTIYQDYERAFSETTDLPVSLMPVESWKLPHQKIAAHVRCDWKPVRWRADFPHLFSNQKD